VHVKSIGKYFGSTTESISEGGEFTSNVGKEMAVEVESQAILELFDRSGSREILNGCDVGVHRRDASSGNGVAR
jgi:hypothetical protein